VEKCSREGGTGTIGLGIQNRFESAKYEGTRRGFMRPRCVRATVSEGLRLEVEGGYPTPGCFRERGCKRLKTKGGSAEKSAKRRERGGKCLKAMDLPPRQGRGRQRHRGTEFRGGLEACTPTPRGNADRCQNKGVAGKAIRKNMKTKG
jgi:hypothetical protein